MFYVISICYLYKKKYKGSFSPPCTGNPSGTMVMLLPLGREPCAEKQIAYADFARKEGKKSLYKPADS